MAFKSFWSLFTAGHSSTHKEQPVQSSTDTLIINLSFSSNVLPLAFVYKKPFGALDKRDSSTTFERITECGQTNTHVLH